MLEKKVLSLKISDSLKEKLAMRSKGSGLRCPIPSLSTGRWDDDDIDRVMIGFYERDRLPCNDPIRLVEADGIEFVVIQDWLCDELEGKILDVVNGELTLI